MRIELDELTCPVCGREHADHIINGPAAYHDVLWESHICDACDSWAWLIEADATERVCRDDRLWTNDDNACFMRGRVDV